MRLGLIMICAGHLGACAYGGPTQYEAPSSQLEERTVALSQPETGVYQLSVSKTALQAGSRFLLSTSAIIRNTGKPLFSGMLSRVVTFKQADGKVHMLESLEGAAVDPDLANPNVLASFPIVSEDDAAVGLNFNEGAKTFLTSSDWSASDLDGSDELLTGRFMSEPLVQRYVDQGTTDAKGRITIRQIAQSVDLTGATTALELRYFLRSYEPDPSYERVASNQDYRWVGYFESAPQRVAGTSREQRYLSRFHPDKPLIYAISSNTPAEVAGAVRDGILYWNRALGRDWITVIDAPPGVTAPDIDYNLVQWVTERDADYAYADAQLDPLTGQVTNAQVYMPSAWYESASNSLADSLAFHAAEAMDHAVPAGSSAERAVLTRDMARVGACRKVGARALREAAPMLANFALTPEASKLAALDWVRSLTAHEVGHTLGLRHNFAGSLGANIRSSELKELLGQYFETGGDWPSGKVTGSSVMEYTRSDDDLAIGAGIRLGHPALAHDVVAMKTLYDLSPVPAQSPYFCTDSQDGTMASCRVFDRGADILDSIADDIEQNIQNAALEYLLAVRSAKIFVDQDLFGAVSPEQAAANAFMPRTIVAGLLSSSARLLESDRALGAPSFNAGAIHEDSLARAEAAIARRGGYAQYFGLLPDDFGQRFEAQLNEVLSKPWFTTGESALGEPFELNGDDIARIRAFAPSYIERYRQGAAFADVYVLSLRSPTERFEQNASQDSEPGAPPMPQPQWEAPAQGEALQALLAERVEHYLTAADGVLWAQVSLDPSAAGCDAPPGQGPSAACAAAVSQPLQRVLPLPRFTYPAELRQLAPQILAPSQSADRSWALDVRDQPSQALGMQLDEAAGGSFAALSTEGSERAAQRWILDNQAVLGAARGEYAAEP